MARPTLSRVVLLVRDVRAAAEFYTNALGLRALAVAENHATLQAAAGLTLDLAAATRYARAHPLVRPPLADRARSEAQLACAYSPLLTFTVDDLDTTLPRLLKLGAALDGAIVRELYGATAAVRAPHGVMIALHQRARLPGDADMRVAAAKVARQRLKDSAPTASRHS